MRASSEILIHVDLTKALAAGIPFLLSENGVVLTVGDEHGHIPSEFFSHVETKGGEALPGWEGTAGKSSTVPPLQTGSFAPNKEEQQIVLEAVTAPR